MHWSFPLQREGPVWQLLSSSAAFVLVRALENLFLGHLSVDRVANLVELATGQLDALAA